MINNTYKVLVWGTGIDYDKYFNNLKYEELRENLEIVALVSNQVYCNKIDSYNVIEKTAITNYKYDYIIISSINKFDEIVLEAMSMGIERKKLLKITIFQIYNFDFNKYIKLYESNLCIISNFCWGGLTYNSLGMEFTSPFINMFESDTDYIKLLSNLKFYLKQPLVFYQDFYEPSLRRTYPIGKIGDIHLYFNHYYSFEEAKAKWEKRLERVNYDNLLITFYATNLQAAELFDNLPFDRKILFVPFKCTLSSAIELDYLQCISSNNLNDDFWFIVNSLATSKYKCYDILKLLNGEKDFMRIE